MSALTDRVNIGTAIIVTNNDRQVLLGKRLGDKHGKDTYSLPGGKPDAGEHPAYAAVRELYEETGLPPFGFMDLQVHTYDRWPASGIHYVTLYYAADSVVEEVANPEPEKCAGWHWYDVDSLPEPLFPGVREAIEQAV